MIVFDYVVVNHQMVLMRRGVFDAFVSGLKEGTRGTIRVLTRISGPPKTLSQLAYYYGVCLPTIHQQLVDDGIEVMGVPVNITQADDIVKHYCAAVRNGKHIDKRDMSKQEAMAFLDNVIRWSAINLCCIIPEPADREGVF